MSSTAAIGQYMAETGDERARNAARINGRTASIVGGLTGAMDTVGGIYAQKQAQDALTKHLNEDLGGDPAETQRVLATRDPDIIRGYKMHLEQNATTKKALMYSGVDATGGPGLADTFMGNGAAAGAPASPPVAVPLAKPPEIPDTIKALPPLPTAESGLGPIPLIPQPTGAGPVASPSVPAASPTEPAWMAVARRAASMPGFDAGALSQAMKMLPAETTPEDQAKIERDKAAAEFDRANADHLRNPLSKLPPAPKPDDTKLTPERAKSLGFPVEWADGETTVGQARELAKDRGIGAPTKTTKPLARRGSKETGFDTPLTPEEEAQFQAWKQKYAPNDSGMDYDLRGAFKAGLTPSAENGHWPDTFKKPNHPTFSDQSIYAVDAPEMAGSWAEDGTTYIPPSRRRPKETDPNTAAKRALDLQLQLDRAGQLQARIERAAAQGVPGADLDLATYKTIMASARGSLPPTPEEIAAKIEPLTKKYPSATVPGTTGAPLPPPPAAPAAPPVAPPHPSGLAPSIVKAAEAQGYTWDANAVQEDGTRGGWVKK